MNESNEGRLGDERLRVVNKLLSGLDSAFRAVERILLTDEGGVRRAPDLEAALPADLPPAASRALDILRRSASIAAPASVAFTGPVPGRTRMREDVPEGRRGVTFLLPEIGAANFVFFIDDEPDRRFEHFTRFAWVNLESGRSQVLSLRGPFTLFPPERTPAPFREVLTWDANGVTFTFGQGEFAGQLRQTPGKAIDAGEARSNDENAVPLGDDTLQESPGEELEGKPPSEPPAPACEKRALVCDFGDKDGLFNLAENFAESANGIEAWLQGEGFQIWRRSQYWGNRIRGVVRFLRFNFLALISTQGFLFRRLNESLAGVSCCHEFFLYIAAHGNSKEVYIFDIDGQGRHQAVPYAEILKTIRDSFPDNVVVTIFIDASRSGGLIDEFQRNFGDLRSKFATCGVTLLTSTDSTSCAFGGQIVDSGTEDFLQGAGEDHDSDNRRGDIKDRFNEMRIQGRSTNPQFFHDGPASWGSLD